MQFEYQLIEGLFYLFALGWVASKGLNELSRFTGSADWAGRREKRFRLTRFRFSYGRMHYETNASGETQ